ncbi:MAG: type II secretion system GspH family protein [Lentisphaerales bacterium]|nr:type II secretion system GspH family protein [Lentisphaerales bacterium]
MDKNNFGENLRNSKTIKPRNFTIVELLACIAIIGILTSMLMPSLHNAREKAYLVLCVHNQRQISLATNIYTDDNTGYFPHSTWLSHLGTNKGWLFSGRNYNEVEDVKTGSLYAYLETTAPYHCPTHSDRTHKRQALTSYMITGLIQDYNRYNWFSIHQMPSGFVLFWEANEQLKGNMWNDGTDTVREKTSNLKKLTMRHNGRSPIVASDGHVELTNNIHFTSELNNPNSNINFCPKHGSH